MQDKQSKHYSYTSQIVEIYNNTNENIEIFVYTINKNYAPFITYNEVLLPWESKYLNIQTEDLLCGAIQIKFNDIYGKKECAIFIPPISTIFTVKELIKEGICN